MDDNQIRRMRRRVRFEASGRELRIVVSVPRSLAVDARRAAKAFGRDVPWVLFDALMWARDLHQAIEREADYLPAVLGRAPVAADIMDDAVRRVDWGSFTGDEAIMTMAEFRRQARWWKEYATNNGGPKASAHVQEACRAALKLDARRARRLVKMAERDWKTTDSK